jgi:pimeloyl-ACP methyl ester carboxylesterase
VAKQTKLSAAPIEVRTRRAYFDCKFGQLHVRTAFPTTGGFDEQAPLICLHSSDGTSRAFGRFLTEIADVRSVYAPDLPGHGESDPSPAGDVSDAAAAVADLARDLRLRQIDVLGFRNGAAVAWQLAAARPELVRKLVLVGVPDEAVPQSQVQPEVLLLRTRLDAAPTIKLLAAKMPHARIADLDSGDEAFDAAPSALATQIGAFLAGRSMTSRG